MNGLDWAVLVIAAAGTVLGYSRGFVGQLISFVGLFIAYLAAFAFYDKLAPLVRDTLALSGYETYQKYEFLTKGLHLDTYVYNGLAFAILFFGVKLAFSVAGRLLNWLASVPGLKLINQWSGALLGFVEASLLIVVAVYVMTVVPNDTAQRLLKQSVTAPYLLEHTPLVTGKLQELWEKTELNSSSKVKI
ncbi:CvpA family protein [Paenibacillus filicis]|uniref:CvpA family protein n=1 Tax=Paenibacillus gyeongsangnamensis TaxID=3388067 RepID=A0ABT4QI14_9BACL|nr:CvpA family protein [Paenibacillus filicis]MCZ8516366.1 CvpA family protein [Paenibacillus filicis]